MTVGVIGLGIMGGALAANMLQRGMNVVGCDISRAALDRLQSLGGTPAASAREVVDAAEISFSLLPSVEALTEVTEDVGRRSPVPGQTRVLLEMSTLPLSAKLEAERVLAAAGVTLLDCPLSGTGAQAAVGDLVVFGSGDEAAFSGALPYLEACTHKQIHVGAFGNGSKFKFLANLLVAVHNVAAAEAFALGQKAGLDPRDILGVLADSAGGSRMLNVRGPLMVDARYDAPTFTVANQLKDNGIIGEFARELGADLALFRTAAAYYDEAAMRVGRLSDTASVCAVAEHRCGLDVRRVGQT